MAVLKAKDPLTGVWQDVAGVGTPGVDGPTGPEGPTGPTGPIGNEVIVGPDDPLVADPTALVDVWYDTDEPDPPPVGGDQFVLRQQMYANDDFTGPWDYEGSADTIFVGMKAGTYLLLAGCTGMTASTGARGCDVKMDGVVVANVGKWFNTINTHEFMGLQATRVTVTTDGDHTFGFQVGSNLNSDVNDRGFIVLIPA